MFQKIIITFLSLLLSISSFSQNSNKNIKYEPIQIVRARGGYMFRQGSDILKGRMLKETLYTNELAEKYYHKVQANKFGSNLFGITGGALIGFYLGSWIGGTEINPTVLYVGAGLTALSIPFSIGEKACLRKSIRAFNDGLSDRNASTIKPELSIGFNTNGVGLKLNF